MVKWLIQKTKIEEHKINELIHLLEKASIEFEIVTPFKGKIFKNNSLNQEFTLDLNQQYFVCGSYHLTRYVSQQMPSAVYSLEKYSFEDFWNIFDKNNFVNNDAISCKTNDIDWSKSEELFVRPLEDTKSFSGGVYNKNTLKYQGNVIVAPLKQISKEHRFFVIDNKIIGGSLYKLNGSLYESAIVDQGALEFAQEMVKKFPYDGYVIDIATINNEYKIMELNCLNAAGFYSLNLYNLVIAVEEHYQNKKELLNKTENKNKR